jgi:hypothetical protein
MAAVGASVGAAVGSAILPGIGTVLGGLIGGLFGGHDKPKPPPADPNKLVDSAAVTYAKQLEVMYGNAVAQNAKISGINSKLTAELAAEKQREQQIGMLAIGAVAVVVIITR